jgi:hypothetical protein
MRIRGAIEWSFVGDNKFGASILMIVLNGNIVIPRQVSQ